MNEVFKAVGKVFPFVYVPSALLGASILREDLSETEGWLFIDWITGGLVYGSDREQVLEDYDSLDFLHDFLIASSFLTLFLTLAAASYITLFSWRKQKKETPTE